MTHLNKEQLLHLTSTAVRETGFAPEEIQQLEHLKICKSCYMQFCILSAIQTALDDDCYYHDVLPSKASQIAPTKTNCVLATLQVITGHINGMTQATARQIFAWQSSLQFVCAMPLAVRGASKNSHIMRLEDLGDDKTYILFDPERKELAVQIDPDTAGSRQVHVYLAFPHSADLEFPLQLEGSLLKGILTQLPEQNFTIRIETQ